MNNFVKNLTRDSAGILEQRANLLGKETNDAQIDLIRALEAEERVLEKRQLDLTDLSPENSFDLKPGGKNYNAQNWVKEMQNIKIGLLNVKIQLVAAKETLGEWFSELAVPTNESF